MLARAALEPGIAGRSQQTAWEEALAASGLPVAGLDGPRGRPRFAAAAPLGATIPGEAELLDVWLTERLPRWRVRDALTATLPQAHVLADLYDVWLGEAPLPGRVSASVYRAVLEPVVDVAAIRIAAAGLIAQTTLPRERRKGETTVAYDLRPFIGAVEVDDVHAARDGSAAVAGEAAAARPDAVTVRMTLRHDPERGIGRPEEVLAALSERLGVGLDARSLVRERLVLSAPPERAAPPASSGGSRPRPGTEGPRPSRPGSTIGR